MPFIIFRSFINARKVKKKKTFLFECKTLPVLIMIKERKVGKKERKNNIEPKKKDKIV